MGRNAPFKAQEQPFRFRNRFKVSPLPWSNPIMTAGNVYKLDSTLLITSEDVF